MAYDTSKLSTNTTQEARWGTRGQSGWSVHGFETVDDAKAYINDKERELWGYSVSGRLFEKDGEIFVHMSCWNTCD